MSDNVDARRLLTKAQVFQDHKFQEEEEEVVEGTVRQMNNVVMAFVKANNPAGAESACYLFKQLLSNCVAANNLDHTCLEDVEVDERGLVAELEDLQANDNEDLNGGDYDDAAAAADVQASNDNALTTTRNGLTAETAIEIGGALTPPTKITIRIPFTSNITAADYKDAMEDFKVWLAGRTTKTLIKRSDKWVCLHDHAMDCICRILFEQMTSQPALVRFNKILTEAAAEETGEGSPSAALIAGAKRTQLDMTKPKEMRMLARAAESYFSSLRQVKSETKSIDDDIKAVDMYERYSVVEKGTKDRVKKAFWRNEFDAVGIPKGRGIDMQSRMQQYMAHCFGVETKALMERFRNVKPVWEMVKMNTAGILVLLPRDAVRVLRRAGGSFWVDILMEFNRRFPEFLQLCRILNQHVIKPILSGRLDLLPKVEVHPKVQGSPLTSVYERILDSCEQGQVETDEEEEDVSMGG